MKQHILEARLAQIEALARSALSAGAHELALSRILRLADRPVE